jgi:hypothetical protein
MRTVGAGIVMFTQEDAGARLSGRVVAVAAPSAQADH